MEHRTCRAEAAGIMEQWLGCRMITLAAENEALLNAEAHDGTQIDSWNREVGMVEARGGAGMMDEMIGALGLAEGLMVPSIPSFLAFTSLITVVDFDSIR